MVLKYPYGTRAKQRFRVRGQPFEGKEVRFLRQFQGLQNKERIPPVQEQTVRKTEVAETSTQGDRYRSGILRTATSVPPFA